jgi:hypothetical protein
MSMDFAALIPVDVQRATLEADRQRFIVEGYDNQRARDRVAAVDANAPEIAQLEANMNILANAITAIDEQLTQLN